MLWKTSGRLLLELHSITITSVKFRYRVLLEWKYTYNLFYWSLKERFLSTAWNLQNLQKTPLLKPLFNKIAGIGLLSHRWKGAPAQVFFSWILWILKNTFFYRTRPCHSCCFLSLFFYVFYQFSSIVKEIFDFTSNSVFLNLLYTFSFLRIHLLYKDLIRDLGLFCYLRLHCQLIYIRF